MANNIDRNQNYNFPPAQPWNPGGMAAYLLSMAPMPPPHHQDIAVAMANWMLNNPGAGAHEEDDEDENINPQLWGPASTQAASKYLYFWPSFE